MRGKLFKQIFWAAMAFFVICLSLMLAVSYHYESTQYYAALQDELLYIRAGVEEAGTDFLTQATARDGERIRWISPQGDVLYDSRPSDAAQPLGDGAVQQALTDGRGESYRTENGVRTVCYAVRLQEGGVVCLSAPCYSFFSLLMSLFTPLILALAALLVLALLLARQVAHSVIQPIVDIDLTSPDERDVYPELQPLVRRINAQNRQIRHQIDELKLEHERQDGMRREFTANVSHELKTPLTSISGYAELMQEGAVRQEDIRRFSGKIYDEAQRLITLVGDIIRLSQLDSRENLPHKTSTDLWELCQTVLSQLEHAARKRSVTLHLTGDHATVFGAEHILSEMVYNLCDNAIKYNREGGSVTVELSVHPDGTQLCVRDTGIGIPQEEFERIFERFYRVDKSHSREVGGTGLGLSIVKHAAAYHQATITVDSALGVGTAITLRFPPLVAE